MRNFDYVAFHNRDGLPGPRNLDVAGMRAKHNKTVLPNGRDWYCLDCERDWPCDAIRALDRVEEQSRELNELKQIISECAERTAPGKVMRRIDVYNRESACKLAAMPDVAVISISAPGKAAPLMEGWAEVLRLEFHDIDPTYGEPPEMVPFNDSHVEQVFAFAERNRERDLMIHCDAGVSRSVAVGLFISTEFGGELHTHTFGRVYTGAANGHVLRLLNRRVWLDHFAVTPTEVAGGISRDSEGCGKVIYGNPDLSEG